MKILHAADLHLDTPFTGRSEEAVSQLKKAMLAVPGTLAQLCKSHNCDLMLLSGDLFDGDASRQSIDALKTALQEAAVPVFITPGNHDFCNPTSPWMTEIWPKNVHIFTKPVMESVSLPDLDCRIYGAGFQSMDCPALLKNFRAEGRETYHIGILHGDPLQRNTPYCPITQAQVAGSGLHYLALGHIHKAGQFTAGSTLCAWPGCPMGRGNDETGEKGVYLVTVGETTHAQFLPLATPRFYDLEVEVFSDALQALRAILPPTGSKDFYRVTLTGECPPFAPESIALPQFPNLEVRDRTVPPTDLWGCIEQDNLEGIFFRMLHEELEQADEDSAQQILLAAKITRRILDGREVALP